MELEQLVGKTEAEAGRLIKENDMKVRVTMKDGDYFIITQDLRFDRVNLHIKEGLVVSAKIG
jgi:hypothetical protein